jgi:hypothetical protein
MPTETEIQADQIRVLAAALSRLHQRFRPEDVVVTPAGDGVWTLVVPTAAPGVMWRGGFVNGLEGWFCRVAVDDPETPLEARRITPLPLLDAPPPSPAFNTEAIKAATAIRINAIRSVGNQADLGCRQVQDTDEADVRHLHPSIEHLDWLAPEGSDFDPRIDLYRLAQNALDVRTHVQDLARALDAGRAHIAATMPALRDAVIAAVRRTDASFLTLGTRQAPKHSDVEKAHDEVGARLDELDDVIRAATAEMAKLQLEERAARRIRTARVLVREGATAIRDANRKLLEARIERLKTVMAAEQMVAEEP